MNKIIFVIFTVLLALTTMLCNISLVTAQQTSADHELYKQAKKMVHAEKWEEAIEAYREIITTFPKSKFVDDAQFWIGYCYENWEGHQEQAIEEFQKLVERYPGSPWVDDACNNQIIIAGQIYQPMSKEYDRVVFRALGNLLEFMVRMCEGYQQKVDQKLTTLKAAQEKAIAILREQTVGLRNSVMIISEEGEIIQTEIRKAKGRRINPQFEPYGRILREKKGIYRRISPHYTYIHSYSYYKKWGWIIVAYFIEKKSENEKEKYAGIASAGKMKSDRIRQGLKRGDPEYTYVCFSTERKLKIDSILDECQGAVPIVLNDSCQTSTYFHSPGRWQGPQDLSARVYLLWNQDYLYFAAEVTDDIRNQPYRGSDAWQGDGIQICFDTQHDRAPGIMKDDYEYGFTLTPKGKEVFSYFWGFGVVEGVKLAIRQQREHVWIYEAALPWKLLKPFVPKDSAVMGMNVLINDNDGKGREDWIEWTAGIGDSKNPSLYGKLVFKSGF